MRAELGDCDKADADSRAAARAVESRERRLGLTQGWNVPQPIGGGHTPFALGASEFAAPQLGVCRLEVGEADSLLPSHVAPLSIKSAVIRETLAARMAASARFFAWRDAKLTEPTGRLELPTAVYECVLAVRGLM